MTTAVQKSIQLWNRAHPQTVKIAVGLSYWLAVISLLSLGGAFGTSGVAIGILSLLARVGLNVSAISTAVVFILALGLAAVAVGMANDKKFAWQAAAALAIASVAGLALAVILDLGAIMSDPGMLFSVVIDVIFTVAWLVALVHPMTREYVKIWFD